MILSFEGITPDIAPDAFIAPDANLLGRVSIGPEASVWFGTTIRGDNERITLGRGSNVQELCVLHSDMGYPLTIGADCTIGHRAILHGCTIGDGSLIGMGAIVMNGVRIGRGCLIGAGALVPEGREIPDGSLVMGMPAKIVRALDPEAIAQLVQSAAGYRARARAFRTAIQGETR
jgi:carbonic anhydrase/acetyltransferase-like protein (isoleucine patch superfamily)